MGVSTGISWTDSTFNPWRGCSKVSPACKNCYAMAFVNRFGGDFLGRRVVASESYWKEPLKWNRNAEKNRERARVFCASLADLFESLDLTEWASICDGYRISIFGEIQSQWRSGGSRGEWETIQSRTDKGGYQTIQLRKHPTLGDKTLKVHRLVLSAFVGDCPNGMVVRHLDGCGSNNVLWNLSYSTQSENLSDRSAHGTEITGERNGRSKLTEVDVAEIRKRLSNGESQSSIARDYGVKQVAISRIYLNKSWSTKPASGNAEVRRQIATGQMVDSYGRPLFRTSNGWSHEPDGDSSLWAPLTMNDVRRRLFELIDATPNLDWLLLTKRPENIRRMTYDYWTEKVPGHVSQNEGDGRYWNPRPNVWLGTTVENQEQADKRIPELLKCRDLSPVLFLSCEPMIGPVDLRPALWMEDQYFHLRKSMSKAIDWVICGGESAFDYREMKVEWAFDLMNQCKAAQTKFFMKQMSGTPTSKPEIPLSLMLREFPI